MKTMKTMKTIRTYLLPVLCLVALNMTAQKKEMAKNNTGEMAAVTAKSFTFEKDGKTIPYQVTIHERRNYNSKFDKADKGQVNQDRIGTPSTVAKLITVHSNQDPTFNRLIVLRYKKQVTDTFKLVPTKNGFAVNVDDKSLNYIFDEGVYYANTADKDYFVVDIFDYIL